MKEGEGRISFYGNSAKIHVPSSLILDSTFPFKRKDQDVKVSLDGDSLVIKAR